MFSRSCCHGNQNCVSHLNPSIKPLIKREHPRNAWIFPHLEKLCKKQSKPAFVSYHYIFGKNQYITDVVVFSCLFFSVFDKFNFSSMRAAIGEKYLQILRRRSNFWPSLFVWFFFPEMIHSLYSIFTRSAPKWRTHGRTQKLMG